MRRCWEADGKSLKTVALLEIGITERITASLAAYVYPQRRTRCRADGRRLRQSVQGEVSGAKTDRSELANLIRRLERGDVFVVTRLDRLAGSTRDLLNVIKEVSDHGAGFKVSIIFGPIRPLTDG